MRFNGDVLGSVAGMLEVTGDGDTVDVTPVVTSGTKIAAIVINEGSPEEESIDLYTPEGFSGDYNDLTNKPDLFSGVYEDLTNKPTLNGNTILGNMFTNNYSTNEEIIGKWFGETLYRRVYDFTSSPITVPTNTWLKVANDWQIIPIRGTVVIPSSRSTFDVAVDCDENDGLYIRSWLDYTNVTYLIVEYTKTIY